MSLTTGEMSAADLAAVVGNNNDGFGGNNGSWWIILLFLVLFNGGWNNGYSGNGGNGGNNGFVPYYLANNTDNGVQEGFNNAALSAQLSGIQSAISNGFSSAEVASCNRAMADMERSFASQTAITGGLTNLSSQLAQCCCDNRLATCQTQNVITAESAATRFADAQNTRDILENCNRNNQAILDKLCQLELDAKNDKITDLERQLTMANLAASQTAQNAFIAQGLNNEVDALYNRLSNCPIPTTPVYGRTPIFTCNQNSGCGCGM